MERKDITLITDKYLKNQLRQNPDLEVTLEGNRNEIEIIQSALQCYLAQISIRNSLGVNISSRAPHYDEVKKVLDSVSSPVAVERKNLTTHKDELQVVFDQFKASVDKNDKITDSCE